MSDLSVISSGRPLLLVGCGKMGTALLQGWLARGLSPDAVNIIDPLADQLSEQFPTIAEARLTDNWSSVSEITPSFVLLAVKPQTMDDILPRLSAYVDGGAVFLSIAAGKTLSYFAGGLGKEAAVVRAMPNTPSAIGQGMTGLCSNAYVTKEQKTVCAALMKAVGEVAWVENEGQMDAITAVSGSGPAYVFHMAEAMIAAGEAVGLSADDAKRFALKTLYGSVALLEQSGEEAGVLRKNVTSPAGTTEAALNVLMAEEDGLTQLMTRAMQAAAARSRELSE